ncbi:putative OmpA-like domain-containing protein [Azospirillaceae bacterium]
MSRKGGVFAALAVAIGVGLSGCGLTEAFVPPEPNPLVIPPIAKPAQAAPPEFNAQTAQPIERPSKPSFDSSQTPPIPDPVPFEAPAALESPPEPGIAALMEPPPSNRATTPKPPKRTGPSAIPTPPPLDDAPIASVPASQQASLPQQSTALLSIPSTTTVLPENADATRNTTQVASAPPAVVMPPEGRIVFENAATAIPESAAATIAEYAAAMQLTPGMRIQLRSYASGNADTQRQARQLSMTRALALREMLTQHGVRSTRIDVRPLGIAPEGPSDRIDVVPVN